MNRRVLMRDLTTLKFHPTTEKIVDMLSEKTQNTNPQFFRMMVCYYICKMAATMRVKIKSKDKGVVPINYYGINLGISGIGKGHSTNIIEDQIINQFRTTFFEQTLPTVVEENLAVLASKRANVQNNKSSLTGVIVDPGDELISIKKEYESLGKLAFSFDSGTTAAVKQMRHKLLMAGIGAMNLEIDEIGSNLLGNAEVLNTFMELFDVGKVKQKLTKNTKENTRSEEIEGKTPTNLMLFGTPIKLFDGAKVEEEFWSFISTGYGRRCFFGYTKQAGRNRNLTASEIYDRLTSKNSENFLRKLSTKFGNLAQRINYDSKILIPKAVSLQLIEYQMHCEDIADSLGDHDEARKAEISHRYFKALKLAGAFAFIDGHGEVTEDNLYHAIHMAEESGRAFKMMTTQDRPFVKLAKYIAAVGREVTHVDLIENLAFYKGTTAQKNELMQLAVDWGYKNSVIIKRKFTNNIEFMIGETLDETNLQTMYLSHSNDLADDYHNVQAPFDKLDELVTMKDHHWCNHHTATGRRTEESMAVGFNMVVLDIDGGVKIDTVKLLLKDYKYLLHTTKRHTEADHRFRVILPINYMLKLTAEDFKEFMQNIYSWLPFDSDTGTGQRSRKWLTNDQAIVYENDVPHLLDALLFIPRTSKNDQRQLMIKDTQDLTNIERWFVANIEDGNRNNQLLKYGFMIIDSGYNLVDTEVKVDQLNQKLPNPLTIDELKNTIYLSLSKKFYA